MNGKRFVLKTMGCKANQFEGGIIIENLVNNGFEQVKVPAEADFFILNSCTVTHKSDNEALYLLRNAKHENPQVINVITGCVAQVRKEELLEFDYVDIVLGNDEKLDIANYLDVAQNCVVADLMSKKDFNPVVLNDITKTRIGLKIQDGCNSRCAYCIIPFARGKSRSADIEFLVDQINKYAEHGYKEVVLTGIHIGQWGKEWGKTLLDLLKEIEKTNILRYRLGSLNPSEIDDELLDFLQTSRKFCPHFHLSLQSACDKTLRAMNRFYKVEDYLAQIEDIKRRFDKPFLGSDIIVGFPGETEEDFEVTYENLKRSGLTQIHTFPYSVRPGTVAADLPNQIPDEVKVKRADRIKQLSKEKLEKFMNAHLGIEVSVLLEKRPDKNTGMYKGVTKNYLTVIVESDEKCLFNTIQNLKIEKKNNGKLVGSIVLQ